MQPNAVRGGGVGYRGRLRAADPEVNRTSGDGSIASRINDGKFARCEGEGDVLRSACGQMDMLEASEGTKGGALDAGMGEIEFDDVVTGDFRGVRDVRGNDDRRGAGEFGSRVSRLRP